MALKIYNSLSHELEVFIPQNDQSVSFYSCGPTVYNYAHIGNFRAYMFADTLKRSLSFLGYKVLHVMNYTDVDDKIIRDAVQKDMSLTELTTPYILAFNEDIAKLNILPATKYTKATDYIMEMVDIIETLLQKGYAYKTDDGSVYFEVAKDHEYGKLVSINKDTLKENAKGRMKSDEYDKDSAQDFALWKSWDEKDGDIYWDTSLGRGRPGWHIECSAMSMKELGETIDIHTGGVDNKFPHHENEIAQSECSTGKTFSKYFMHNEHMLVNGKKMSKSLDNFYTLRDLENLGYDPLAFRYLLLTSHYRTQINFSLETLTAAATAYTRLKKYIAKNSTTEGTLLSQWNERFIAAISNDLSTAESLALVWDIMRSDESESDIAATILHWDNVLGLDLANIKDEEVPAVVSDLVAKRIEAKAAKDWTLADSLRTQIQDLGYDVLDQKDGTSDIRSI